MTWHDTNLLALDEAALRLADVARQAAALRTDISRDLLHASIRRQRRAVVLAAVGSDLAIAAALFAAVLLR